MRRLNIKITPFVLVVFALILFMVTYFFFIRNNKENTLIEEGNNIISKIEVHYNKTGHLPKSLIEIGINETVDFPLYYEAKDSVHFIVWFGTSLGESKIYYSDTKTWENHYRPFVK